jgi:hypothetical protein
MPTQIDPRTLEQQAAAFNELLKKLSAKKPPTKPQP